MQMNSKCRLCYMTLNEECQHCLFNTNGQPTHIYEVTVKYFDPTDCMLLHDDDNDKKNNDEKVSKAICDVCWEHIKEFHEFQQGVLKALVKLTEGSKTSQMLVKEETEIKLEVDEDDDIEELEKAMSGEIVLIMEHGLNDYYNNDDLEEEDYLKKLTKEDKIKSINDKENEIEKEDNDKDKDNNEEIEKEDIKTKDLSKKKLKNTKNVKDKIMMNDSSEELLVTVKRTERISKKKTKSKNYTSDDAKSAHYNSLKKIEELDNFITEVKPQLECDICKELLNSYNDLRQHFTDKHQTKCYVLCCGKKIYRRYLLVEHLRVHVNPDSFKCDICGVSSSSSRSLHAHKRFIHGNIKLLECEICHKNFKTKPILTRHMDIHNDGTKDFKCPDCNRSYGSDYQLKAHINKIHHEAQICDQCGKTVHGATALKLHIIHKHGGIKPTKFPCDQCDTELASKKSLQAHKLSFHNDGLTAFICKVCGKIASSETALMRHKKYVHEMERKYKCQYCDKAFKKTANLKEHISIHTGQHLYQCYHCPQTFGNSANMHNHRKKVHPEEFALARENRVVVPRIDLNSVEKQVLL